MSLDLAVLVADRDIEQACLGILGRQRSLGIRAIRHTMLVDSRGRDPGCFLRGHEILEPFAREAAHGLVVLDRSWEGAPAESAEDLAVMVEDRLRVTWGNRARSVVIDPEVEVWLWSDSPHVASAMGWTQGTSRLRRFLEQEEAWDRDDAKPRDPKRALSLALRASKTPRSSAIFRRIADRVGLERCSDPGFNKLKGILRDWFGV